MPVRAVIRAHSLPHAPRGCKSVRAPLSMCHSRCLCDTGSTHARGGRSADAVSSTDTSRDTLGPPLYTPLSGDDVGVVAASCNDHVALADRRATRGVERVPVTHPRFDPRVALARVGLGDHAVGVRIEIARRVPGGDARRRGAPRAPGARSPGRLRVVRAAPRWPWSTRSSHPARTPRGHGSTARARRGPHRVSVLDGGCRRPRARRRSAIVIGVSTRYSNRRSVSPGALSVSQLTVVSMLGVSIGGLDYGVADDGELAVWAVEIERVHAATPVVAVAEQIRGGVHVDAVFDRELARRVERRDARLVVGRVDHVGVDEGRGVTHPHPRDHVTRSTRRRGFPGSSAAATAGVHLCAVPLQLAEERGQFVDHVFDPQELELGARSSEQPTRLVLDAGTGRDRRQLTESVLGRRQRVVHGPREEPVEQEELNGARRVDRVVVRAQKRFVGRAGSQCGRPSGLAERVAVARRKGAVPSCRLVRGSGRARGIANRRRGSSWRRRSPNTRRRDRAPTGRSRAAPARLRLAH